MALWAYALFMLFALASLADVMPAQVVVLVLATIVQVGVLTSLRSISRHRGQIAARTHDFLPIAIRAADLVFTLLTLPVRFFAAPARARPPIAPGRIGRLPAVTLSPRLLPVPSFARA